MVFSSLSPCTTSVDVVEIDFDIPAGTASSVRSDGGGEEDEVGGGEVGAAAIVNQPTNQPINQSINALLNQ